MQDPTEKHCGDVGILVKYKDNNNNNNNNVLAGQSLKYVKE